MRKTGFNPKQCFFRPRTAVLVTALLSSLLVLAEPMPVMAQAAPQVQRWEVPAGPLNVALNRLATQARVPLTISYSPELVAGRTTQGVVGQHTPIEALDRTLVGTGLALDAVNDTTFALRASSAPGSIESATNRPASTSDASEAQRPVTDVERVSVTGTRIRGAQPSSPLVVITQEEMILSGHSNLGEAIRALPQNFTGGQNPGVQTGAGGGSENQNITGGSSLNLRGLGPDATLTLLNGARLAYDGFTQATDVAVVPLAAIERMDILLDGASALYGSDAVGGVANIILKRNFEGAEVSVRYGEATDGGFEQAQASMVAGATWSKGGVMIAAETASSGAIHASERDYLNYIPRPEMLTIFPKSSQRGVLLSGHQVLGPVELALDAFYTKRAMDSGILLTVPIAYDPRTTIYGLSPSVQLSLSRDWSLRVHGFIGSDDTETNQRTYSATGSLLSRSRVRYDNGARAAGLEFEGGILHMPGGEARASLGGGWRKSEYQQRNLISGASSVPYGKNESWHGFAEINLPIVGESMDVRFVDALSLNGAFRYENYDTFGSASTPKVGLVWRLSPALQFKGSWGKSFKAPTLSQQYNPTAIQLRTAASLGVAGSAPSDTAIIVSGGNAALSPERAKTSTAGLVLSPAFLPGTSIELNWFHIDYVQRVVTPFQLPSLGQFGSTLLNTAYDDFLIRSPTPGEQALYVGSAANFYNFTGGMAYVPESVVALFDNRNVNASSQRIEGVDASITHSLDVLGGVANFNAGGSWVTASRRNLIPMSSTFATAGVVGFPPKFKGRMSAHWVRNGLTLGAIVNHIGGVDDTMATIARAGSSMTTLDLIADYDFTTGWLGGFGVNVSVANIFNRAPPLLVPIAPYYVNYDSTNYAPLGRVIAVTLTKRFQ